MRWTVGAVTKGWITTFAGSVLQIGPNFLTSLLIARLFGPSDYGLYAMLTGIRTLAGVVVDGGLTNAATKAVAATWAEEPEQAWRTAQTFFWMRMGLATLGAVIAVVPVGWLANSLLRTPGSESLLFLTLLGLVAAAVQSVPQTLLFAAKQFTRASMVMVTGALLSLITVSLLAWGQQLTLVNTLLWSGIVSTLVTALVAYRLLPERGSSETGIGKRILLQRPDHTDLRQIGLPLLRFGGWIWLSTLITTALAYLDLFWLNYWTTPDVVGTYARALNLATRVSTVNGSLYPVLLPMASALVGRVAILRYLRHGLVRSGIVGLLLLLLIPPAGWAIPLLYGPAYQPSVLLFRLMLGIVIIDLLTLPAMLLIYPAERPQLATMGGVLQLVAFLALGSWLIPLDSARGAVIAKLGARLLNVAFVLISLAFHYGAASSVVPSTVAVDKGDG